MQFFNTTIKFSEINHFCRLIPLVGTYNALGALALRVHKEVMYCLGTIPSPELIVDETSNFQYCVELLPVVGNLYYKKAAQKLANRYQEGDQLRGMGDFYKVRSFSEILSDAFSSRSQ